MKIISRLGIACRMRPAAALAPVLLAGAAFATSQDEHREHAAHEHGHGTLDIVVEGEELVIELRIPAVNVVGFEHAPRDQAEREAVRRALVPFGDAASVVVVPSGAECEVEEAEADIRSMADEGDHEGDRRRDGEGHDHDDDRHGTDEPAKDEHEEREAHEEHEEHEAQGSDSGAEAHSELHATYRFHCHVPQRLDRIDVRVFEHLRDAEEVDVRVVTPSAQLAMELRPGSTVVELMP